MIVIPPQILKKLPWMARKARHTFAHVRDLERPLFIGILRAGKLRLRVYCEERCGDDSLITGSCHVKTKQIFIHRSGIKRNRKNLGIQRVLAHEVVHILDPQLKNKKKASSIPTLDEYINSPTEVEAETSALAQIVAPVLWKDPICKHQLKQWFKNPYNLSCYEFLKEINREYARYWSLHGNRKAIDKLIESIKLVLQIK